MSYHAYDDIDFNMQGRRRESTSPSDEPPEGMKLSELRVWIQDAECPFCQITGSVVEETDGAKTTFYCPSCLSLRHEHTEIGIFDDRERIGDRDDSNKSRNISTQVDRAMLKIEGSRKEGDIVCMMRKDPEREMITTEEKLAKLKKNKSQTGAGGWGQQMIPGWKASSDARMQLERGGDLEDRLVRVFPDIDWGSKISNLLENAILNKRKLRTEEGEKIITNVNTRLGLEAYVSLTCENRSFWFFEEFLHMYYVHLESADRHLSEGHPLNTILILGNVKERSNSIFKGESESPKKVDSSQVNFLFKALSRHLDFEPWNLTDHFQGEIQDAVWDKLELRGRRESNVTGLRCWVPYEDEQIVLEGGVKYVLGGLRKQGTLHLSHIPVAYVIAQLVYDEGGHNGVDGNQIAKQILQLIDRDLAWCEADRGALDKWWEGIITNSKGDPEWSVTRL